MWFGTLLENLIWSNQPKRVTIASNNCALINYKIGLEEIFQRTLKDKNKIK